MMNTIMAHESGKLARNTALQIAGKAIGILLGLATVAVLFRYLQETGFGEFTTAITYLSIFAVIVDFGLTLTTVQMISEPGADEPKILGNIFALRILSGLVVFTLAPIIALLFPYSPIIKLAIAVGSMAYFFSSTSQMLGGVFQKRLEMWRVVLAELVGRLILLVGSVFVALTAGSMIEVVLAIVIGNFAQLAITLLLARPFVRIKSAIDLAIWKMILSRSWPIGVSIIFNVVYLRGDILFLSFFRDDAEVGFYGAAYKIIDTLTAIPVLFMGLILPMLVSAWSDHNRERFAALMQKSFDFFVLLGLPIAVGAYALATPLMVLFGGERFAPSGAILQVLAPTIFIVFVGALYGHAIVGIRKQKPMAFGYAITAVVSIAAYLYFVPRFGGIGAAWVTFISEALLAAITYIVVVKTSGASPRLTILWKSALACLIMFVTLTATPDMHVLLQVVLGVLAYTAAAIALKMISVREVRNLFLKRAV